MFFAAHRSATQPASIWGIAPRSATKEASSTLALNLVANAVRFFTCYNVACETRALNADLWPCFLVVCDWKIHDNPPRAPQSECNTICTGVNDTYCGGPDRIQIFTRDPAFPRPTAPLTVNGYFLSGCYTYVAPSSFSLLSTTQELFFEISDNPHVRTLERRINLAGGMTIGKCTVACRSAGFTRAGVEFGDECCKFSFFGSTTSA